MSEFGHIASCGGGLCVDGWGVGPFVISVGPKSWRFEDSDRFGPSLIKKIGDICANPWPTEGSPFWRAHRLWVKQGRRTEDGYICIWEEPKPTKYRRIGRSRVVTEHGDPDGGHIEIDPFSGVSDADQ